MICVKKQTAEPASLHIQAQDDKVLYSLICFITRDVTSPYIAVYECVFT